MKTKVRLTTFARKDADLLNRLMGRYNQGKTKWKDMEFVADESYDKLVVLTFPYEETLRIGYDERKTITFMTEPSVSFHAKPHPTSHIIKAHLQLPFLPSDILGEKQFCGNGSKIIKSQVLSCVTSELAGLSGHVARLYFIYRLDQLVKEGLDIYGKPINGRYFKQLTNYKGSLQDKFTGLWNYAYHFACENSFEKGYFTEKLIDPIISETLCFYDGCPDIEDYVDDRAYVKISVDTIESAIETIFKSIEDNLYQKRLPFIQREKLRFLTDLHPFNLIRMAVHEMDVMEKVKINRS